MSVDVNAKRYQQNLQDELDSAMLYRALAKNETKMPLARVYDRLADTEESHAKFWEDKLRAAGREPPARRAGWRARVLAALAGRFGPGFDTAWRCRARLADSADNASRSRRPTSPRIILVSFSIQRGTEVHADYR